MEGFIRMVTEDQTQGNVGFSRFEEKKGIQTGNQDHGGEQQRV